MNKSKQTYHYGVDFGGRNCVISEYNGINCQIKENAYSERLTFVGLVTDGIKLYYGRAAKTNLIRLYNNSACELKEYLGKYIVDGLNIQTENYKFYPSEVKIDKNGLCFKLPKLKFNDLNCSDGYFACDTLFVLLMKYLKETMMKEGNEVIICHPCYYNEKQIEYINELYKVCEMKVLKNIPEYLSASLCFGYENNNKLNENEERIVLLLDMGYINCSSTIVKYKKDECEILSHSYNNDKIGGRYIDNLLVNALIGKMGMNIDNISEKLYVKVKEEIIKMKEKLSASGADTIHISIDDGDNDYESDYSVNELNEILKNNGINTKVIDIIKDSIVNSGLIEEEDNKKLEIVIIGGSLRIPLIQKEIENYVKSELDNDINLNRTINMDECMSLGNSYYGLIQSGKWRYSYNEKKIIIHQIESSSRLNNDKCNNTWNVKERISKIYDTIKRICKNESIVQKCASLRNEIEGECYYLQHLLEDNTIINTDENKNEISEVLKRVKSKKLVDNNNYDEIEDLYKRILIKKLNLISEVFRNKYKKESKVSAYLKDINRENKMKNIYIEKIKEKLSIVEDEMRNMNILRGRHKTGGYNSTPSPSNSNNPVPIPVLDNNIILNKRKNSSPVKNIDPSPLPMPQHHQEEIDNLIKELESCINQFPEYPNIRMIKKQIEKIKALPLSSIEYNTQFDKLSSRLENFKIYISDYNNQRNDCIKRITEMICGDGNKNRLNSDDMNRIIRLINDENYHSLQEYKDIISQLTIHKNSRNMINESPPKSSNRDNNIEEGINKVLKQLDDYMKKNPYSPKMKEIKRKMEEANKQNNPVVRFAQLQQILNDLEENDNSYKKNDKNNQSIQINLSASTIIKTNRKEEIPINALSHSYFSISKSTKKKMDLEKRIDDLLIEIRKDNSIQYKYNFRSYLNELKIKLSRNSHITTEELDSYEKEIDDRLKEYRIKSRRKNTSPPVLTNQNIPNVESIEIMNNKAKSRILNRKVSLQPNNQQQYSSNVRISHSYSEIQSLISKLEMYVNNYPFYPYVGLVRELINRIKIVPLNENEYDNQYKKLLKRIVRYEKFIEDYDLKQKEKIDKLKELLMKFKEIADKQTIQLLYRDMIQKAEEMIYGIKKYPINEYENIISEMTISANNMKRKPELTEYQIHSINKIIHYLKVCVKEYPHYPKVNNLNNLLIEIDATTMNIDNYNKFIDILDRNRNDIDNYVSDYQNKKTELTNNIKSILYKINENKYRIYPVLNKIKTIINSNSNLYTLQEYEKMNNDVIKIYKEINENQLKQKEMKKQLIDIITDHLKKISLYFNSYYVLKQQVVIPRNLLDNKNNLLSDWQLKDDEINELEKKKQSCEGVLIQISQFVNRNNDLERRFKIIENELSKNRDLFNVIKIPQMLLITNTIFNLFSNIINRYKLCDIEKAVVDVENQIHFYKHKNESSIKRASPNEELIRKLKDTHKIEKQLNKIKLESKYEVEINECIKKLEEYMKQYTYFNGISSIKIHIDQAKKCKSREMLLALQNDIKDYEKYIVFLKSEEERKLNDLERRLKIIFNEFSKNDGLSKAIRIPKILIYVDGSLKSINYIRRYENLNNIEKAIMDVEKQIQYYKNNRESEKYQYNRNKLPNNTRETNRYCNYNVNDEILLKKELNKKLEFLNTYFWNNRSLIHKYKVPTYLICAGCILWSDVDAIMRINKINLNIVKNDIEILEWKINNLKR